MVVRVGFQAHCSPSFSSEPMRALQASEESASIVELGLELSGARGPFPKMDNQKIWSVACEWDEWDCGRYNLNHTVNNRIDYSPIYDSVYIQVRSC